MKTIFKTFNSSYYNRVCDFLIEISKGDQKHINWNWARWEWMVFHPEFDNSSVDKIGLWFCRNNSELVGISTYDHYFGEAFYAVKEGYENLEEELLEYAIKNFSNEEGLGIAVNDSDNHSIDLLLSHGFVKRNDYAENMLEYKFEDNSFDYTLPKGIEIKCLNTKTDLYKHHKVLWQGFENDGDLPMDEKNIEQQKRMLSAPHLNSYLHTVAVNEDGDYVAYCGCWYSPITDYVYVEPVCTIPQYRKKGLGQAVVLEALKRSYSAGEIRAFVISDYPFYKKLGFVQHSHYNFYWLK